MRRDIIVSIFLFYVLFALLFVVLFPIYFTYGQVFYRSVSVTERIMSVIFVLMWLVLCAFSAYFKKLTCFFGGILYSFLAYLPEMVISKLSTAVPGSDPNLFTSLLEGAMRRLYELVNAPMAGVSVLFPPEKAIDISKWMLPVLVASYVVTQIFRFYRNAYLADQLLLTDAPAGEAAPAQDAAGESSTHRIRDRFAAFVTKMKSPLSRKAAKGEVQETEAAGQDDFTGEQKTGPADFGEPGMDEEDAFREASGDEESRSEGLSEQLETQSDPIGKVTEAKNKNFDISLTDLEAEADSLSEPGYDTGPGTIESDGSEVRVTEKEEKTDDDSDAEDQ
ncbi:MAG: hypothetical protein JW817_07180 [Clostridiales bacterium]|nr:hypothetical protein [Clostridiales bacterium]